MEHAEIVQPVSIMAAAFIGLALGVWTAFGNWSGSLIEPFLIVMLFFVFLAVDGSRLREAFSDRRFTGTALIVNFVWTPLFAILLGYAFFSGNLDVRFGILMLLVTPCTDWFLVFTGVAKGNTALSSAILPLNLIIQVLLLPVYAWVFFGADLSFDAATILWSILVVLGIPIAAATAVRLMASRSQATARAKDSVLGYNDELQTLFLCLAIVAMFASESQVLFDNLVLLAEMLVPLMIFFAVNYLLSSGIGKAGGWTFDDTTSLIFTTMARNSPLALAICAAAFPENSVALLILVIGPLIELPTLALAAKLRLGRRRRLGLQ